MSLVRQERYRHINGLSLGDGIISEFDYLFNTFLYLINVFL